MGVERNSRKAVKRVWWFKTNPAHTGLQQGETMFILRTTRVVICAGLLGIVPAWGQDAIGEDCSAVQDDRERLACYDRAFRQSAPEPSIPEETVAEPAAPAETVVAPSEPEPVTPVPSESTTSVSEPAEPVPESPPATPSAESTAAIATTSAAAGAADDQAAIDEFGADGKLRRDRDEASGKKQLERIEAVIVKVQKKHYGEHVVTLDNGQVWEQREVTWNLKLKEGDVVTIERGAFSSYFLKRGRDRPTKVRRIE